MTECTTQVTLDFHPERRVRVEFDAPEISSDGGWLLLREVDDREGITAGFAACLVDERDPTRVVHDRHEQSRQRIYQICHGYDDCNDADFLRTDRLLNTVCDRTPDDPVGLSSQPTLSRFENACDGRSLRRLLDWLENSYVESLPEDTEVVVLDIDPTDDPTHGQQQLSCFHGYFDRSMYHPLLVFDGDSGQLITTILRPGNAHAARGATGILRRLVRKLRDRFPEVSVAIRGDAGFAMPWLLEEIEALDTAYDDIRYLIGIAKNPALERSLKPEMERAAELFRRDSRPIRRFTSFDYAAGSWPHTRRIVAKAEYTALGRNPRFLVTNLEEFDPELLYRAYCHRGQCENWIKDFKNALNADRLSCSRFAPNFFRLLLHAAAYRLLHALRLELAKENSNLGRAQFDTLRLRLLKVAALVKQSVRNIWVRLPAAFPHAKLFLSVLGRLRASPAPA